ncbi:MAG: hypothetical protein ACW97Z_12110 [Candidatus Hodarchaeales archaeon]
MKHSWILLILFGLFILDIPVIVLVSCFDQNSYGVATGDTFNTEVIELPHVERPEGFTREGFSPPEDVTRPEGQNKFSSLFEEINFDNFILTPVVDPIPSAGTVYTIKILALPDETTIGQLGVTIRGSTKKYDTDFSYGSPIVFTDWNAWIENLDDLEINGASFNEDVDSISVEITTNSATFFQSKIIFAMAVPEELQDRIENMVITQIVRYDKTTGIQDLILVETLITSARGEMIQKIQLEFTTRAATPADYSSLLLYLGLGVVVISSGVFIVNRRHSQSQNLQKDLVRDVQRKTALKEKTRVLDIKARIEEIEKQEKKSLAKAETVLKDKTILKRRRR